MPEEIEYYYRYRDYSSCIEDFNVDGDFFPTSASTVRLEVRKYKVIKHTPKGVWIEENWVHKRFILNDSRKKWAYATKEEAARSFFRRKKSQVKLLSRQLQQAELALVGAEKLLQLPDLLEKDNSIGIVYDRNFIGIVYDRNF